MIVFPLSKCILGCAPATTVSVNCDVSIQGILTSQGRVSACVSVYIVYMSDCVQVNWPRNPRVIGRSSHRIPN